MKYKCNFGFLGFVALISSVVLDWYNPFHIRRGGLSVTLKDIGKIGQYQTTFKPDKSQSCDFASVIEITLKDMSKIDQYKSTTACEPDHVRVSWDLLY